jgi:steroid delta-isomerase-like uncharacterized protein
LQACADCHSEEGTVARQSDLWDRFEAAFVKGDYDGLVSLFADDGVYIEPAGRHVGRDGIRAWIDQWRDAVSDLRFDTSLVVADGDVIIAEYSSYSTFSGPLTMPDESVIPPSGETNELPGVTILRVKDGLIVEARDYFDQALMMTHLGRTPGA